MRSSLLQISTQIFKLIDRKTKKGNNSCKPPVTSGINYALLLKTLEYIGQPICWNNGMVSGRKMLMIVGTKGLTGTLFIWVCDLFFKATSDQVVLFTFYTALQSVIGSTSNKTDTR